jgi:heptosyltransferase-1
MHPLPEGSVIVVLELGFVGDSIMTLPTMAAVRDSQPGARIVRVINAAMAQLWRGCPYCDELLPFDRAASKLGEGRRLLRELRARRPAAFVNLHTPDRDRPARFYWRDAAFALATGSRLRLAWSHGPDAWLATHAVPRSRFGDANMAEEMFRVAEPLAAAPPWDEVRLWLGGEHRAEAERQLSEGLSASGSGWPAPFLAVAPFAKLAEKELAVDALAELVDAVRAATGLTPVLLGGPADTGKMARLRGALSPPFVDLVGCNGLMVAAAILERADATLAVDSGLMHLAAVVGSPVVALFGPMPVHRWRPFRGDRLVALVGRTRGRGGSDRPPFRADEVVAAVRSRVASRRA